MASFELSKTTGKILRNFAGISSSLLLKEGTTQRTLGSGKSILAIAELPEAWPKETGIYSMTTFLSALSLFDKPAISFGDESMTLSEGASRIKYRYADPSTIQSPPEKNLAKDNPAVEFTLPEGALVQLNKSCALMELKSITVVVEAGDVVVRASDVKNPASHAFEYAVPAADVTLHDPKFSTSLTFKHEHIDSLLGGSYTVALSTWKWGYFTNKSEPVSYFVVATV